MWKFSVWVSFFADLHSKWISVVVLLLYVRSTVCATVAFLCAQPIRRVHCTTNAMRGHFSRDAEPL